MVLSNPGTTQCMPLSAGIAQEPVSMTSRLVAETYSVCSRKSAASSWTARMSSVVVDAIELACAGVAHKARAALSGHGMAAGAAFAHPRAADARVSARLNHF